MERSILRPIDNSFRSPSVPIHGVIALAAKLVIGVAIPALLVGCDSSSPPAADATATAATTDDGASAVEAFLQARLDGERAESHVAEGEVALLYASSSGAPYERYEFVELGVAEGIAGRVFRVWLYADEGKTVVEQHLELGDDGIYPRQDWWALGGRLVPATTENGQPLGELFQWRDFRLYDGNDEDTPDNPEVPDVFKSSEWFVGGIFHYLTSEELDTLEVDLAGARALLDDLESHVYWRAQGGEWFELSLVEDITRDAIAPGGEVLPILQHTYHLFPAGSLAPGIYEWRWVLFCTDPLWADEDCGAANVNGEVHIVP